MLSLDYDVCVCVCTKISALIKLVESTLRHEREIPYVYAIYKHRTIFDINIRTLCDCCM